MASSDSASPPKRRKLMDSDPIDLTDDSDHYETIPTQIIRPSPPEAMSNPDDMSPIVQVAASSPLKPLPTPPPAAAGPKSSGGILAHAMRPAGTLFRPPTAVGKPASRPSPAAITLSDDEGPTYRGGGSSEDDMSQIRRRDIQPAKFERRAISPVVEKVEESPNEKPKGMSSHFYEITSKARYSKMAPSEQKTQGSDLSGSIFDSRNRNSNVTSSTITGTAKRSADIMANAYGSVSRGPKKPRQTLPSRAQPVKQPDLDLTEIEDHQTRMKVTKMLPVCTQHSVRACYDTLLLKKGNFDDAIDHLISNVKPTFEIDLTGSDDELAPTPNALRQTQKQQLGQSKSIQQKWGSAQRLPSKPKAPTPATQEKPRKRLVRGKKFDPSPPPENPTNATIKAYPIDSDSDSGLSVASDAVDRSVESRVLSFFNKCTVSDLADTASIITDTATYIISHRPFATLDAVREIRAQDVKPTKSKKVRTPIGEKIVDKCWDMIVAYEAVDTLVNKCGALGKPVAEEMRKWGVNAFGSKQGELEITAMAGVSSQQSVHDSGIGTPASAPSSADEDEAKLALVRHKNDYIQQPSMMSKEITLKDYQVVGLNWLALLYRQKLSCILADEMGLGKTCQVIAFLAHLSETGQNGTHLIVVPSSTLENWLREFDHFCPKLMVRALYGDQKERADIRTEIEENFDTFDVILTTYSTATAKDDAHFLKHQKFCVCVYDEGHMLRNSKSNLYAKLIRIPSKFRLLLTGTPLQNNLQELVSLLGFIMPSVFQDRSDDLQAIFSHKAKTNDANQEALLSAQRIARAKSMLTPFILRRKKHQVLKHMPTKTNRVVYCDMLPGQVEIYASEIERVQRILAAREAGRKGGSDSTNILMRLRHAANHPLLFRRQFDDTVLRRMAKAFKKDPQFAESSEALILEDMEPYTDADCQRLCMKHPRILSNFALKNNEWMKSGKVEKLRELLLQFQREGHRTLIFSQFVMVLDILEWVLESLPMRFFRLDGATQVADRQDLIDRFYEDKETPVFMLSTKAGGAGINLAAANKVIIFDSSFNPQDDIQAENRAHRVGQTKDVEVIRLVTKDTIDEQIYELGRLKVRLDQRVSGEADQEKQSAKTEEAGAKMVEKMLGQKLKERDREMEHKADVKDDLRTEGTALVSATDTSSPVRGVTKEFRGTKIENEAR